MTTKLRGREEPKVVECPWCSRTVKLTAENALAPHLTPDSQRCVGTGLNEREQRIRKEANERWKREQNERVKRQKREAEDRVYAERYFDAIREQQAYRKAADLLDTMHRFPQAARFLRGHAEAMVIPDVSRVR